MKVCLGMPLANDVAKETLESHMRVVAGFYKKHNDIEIFVSCPKCVFPHDRARNIIIREAMMEGCDYLFFVDADMIIPHNAFWNLLGEMRDEGAVAASGFYYRRGYPYTSVWSRYDKGLEKYFQVSADIGTHDIDITGFGCIIIDLKWLGENISEPWCEMGKDKNGTSILDDVSLCTKIREKEGKIIGVSHVRCGHLLDRMVVNDKTADTLRKADVKAYMDEIEIEKQKIERI